MSAAAFATEFLKKAKGQSIALDGELIFSHVHRLIKAVSKMDRPSDVRLTLRTADLGGLEYEFPNPAYGDNQRSNVAFDGKSAIMMMLAGDTPKRQLFNAQLVVDRLEAAGLEYITPEFIEREIVDPDGAARAYVAQAYGPAPYEGQASLIKPFDLHLAGGVTERIEPQEGAGYKFGLRAPAKETALLVLYAGAPEDMFMTCANEARTALNAIEESVQAQLKGRVTALESLTGMGLVLKGIVLAVDQKTGNTKPIRLDVAKEIYDMDKINVIVLNSKGEITQQYLDSDNLDTLETLLTQKPEDPSSPGPK